MFLDFGVLKDVLHVVGEVLEIEGFPRETQIPEVDSRKVDWLLGRVFPALFLWCGFWPWYEN